MKTAFVTGATGTIGSALVPVLLDRGYRVYLLLRAESSDHLAARLAELLAFWELPNGGDNDQLVPLAGDVRGPRFSLKEAQWEELRSEVTHVVHSAGRVKLNQPMDEARANAVAPARELLSLCRAMPRLRKCEYISTVGVAGKVRGTIAEEQLTAPRRFRNTYEAAKAEAENVIFSDLRDLPLTVHRPSMVVGDSDTGKIIHFQVFYHLCRFLTGCQTAGFSPGFGQFRLDVIPADCVAKAIAASLECDETAGKVLHLCSGPARAIHLEHLQTLVRDYFSNQGKVMPRLHRLPLPLFCVGVALTSRLLHKSARSLKGLRYFLDYLKDEQYYETEQTERFLISHGVSIPAFEDYFKAIMGYFQHCNLTPSAT